MKTITAKNEIQVILQEYIGRRKAVEVAKSVYAVMQSETQYSYHGKSFFISEDSNGALVFRMESMAKIQVKEILYRNLEDEEVEECLEQLMPDEMISNIETIQVEGSNSEFYSELLRHIPTNDVEEEFLKNLKTAIEAGITSFQVPIYDMSLDEEGKPCFISGRKPTVGLTYRHLKNIEKKNSGVTLGNQDQFVLFIATKIEYLKKEGLCYAEALKSEIEFVGNAKILEKNKNGTGFILAGANHSPITHFENCPCYDRHYANNSVGWFVIK